MYATDMLARRPAWHQLKPRRYAGRRWAWRARARRAKAWSGSQKHPN